MTVEIASSTTECTITVSNDFGSSGIDVLVGDTVGPGETIEGRLLLVVGAGSFLIDKGEVLDC